MAASWQELPGESSVQQRSAGCTAAASKVAHSTIQLLDAEHTFA